MVGSFLDALARAGRRALAYVLRRIIAGERDAGNLTGCLDDTDTAVVRRALEALSDRIKVPSAPWNAMR